MIGRRAARHREAMRWLLAIAMIAVFAAGERYASAADAHPAHRARGDAPIVERRSGTTVIDINRPRTPFDCDVPLGEQWYGSRAQCLAHLCGGQNVYNEYLFDTDNRRRRNPCYGQSPTEFPGE